MSGSVLLAKGGGWGSGRGHGGGFSSGSSGRASPNAQWVPKPGSHDGSSLCVDRHGRLAPDSYCPELPEGYSGADSYDWGTFWEQVAYLALGILVVVILFWLVRRWLWPRLLAWIALRGTIRAIALREGDVIEWTKNISYVVEGPPTLNEDDVFDEQVYVPVKGLMYLLPIEDERVRVVSRAR